MLGGDPDGAEARSATTGRRAATGDDRRRVGRRRPRRRRARRDRHVRDLHVGDRQVEHPARNDQVGIVEHPVTGHRRAAVLLPDLGPPCRGAQFVAGDRPQRLAAFDDVHGGRFGGGRSVDAPATVRPAGSTRIQPGSMYAAFVNR